MWGHFGPYAGQFYLILGITLYIHLGLARVLLNQCNTFKAFFYTT